MGEIRRIFLYAHSYLFINEQPGVMANHLTKYLNIKKGLIGALIMGGLVYYVNREHGWEPSLVAAGKQALYTFFLGGWLVALCERYSLKPTRTWKGIFQATLMVSAITITAVSVIHFIRGTPEPLPSILITVLIAPPGFLGIAWNHRMRAEQKKTAQHQTTRS
jgi:peptidoglycan/LPS O-acetylase OafA/YrhL